MEGVGHCPEDSLMPRDMFLLQVRFHFHAFSLSIFRYIAANNVILPFLS
jgi:hypothetical protein